VPTVSNSYSTEVEVLLGAPIEEYSERRFVAEIREELNRKHVRALIFSNFLAGRHRVQVDFLVVTEHVACVVELKRYSLPVQGGLNGPWIIYGAGDVAITLSSTNP